VDYLKSEESILRAYLMGNYSADVTQFIIIKLCVLSYYLMLTIKVRPVVNVSTVTYVNITLTIIQIMDLVIFLLFKTIRLNKFPCSKTN
jgi:uncharacterized membrane protein YcgQ (UPF0703/DUF1980 family)